MQKKELNDGYWWCCEPAVTSVLSFQTDYYHNLKFNGTDEDYHTLISKIIEVNPHFKYSWETADDYMYLKNWSGKEVAKTFGWRIVEINFIKMFENELVLRFGTSKEFKNYPRNPYWELSKEDFEELKQKLEEYGQ